MSPPAAQLRFPERLLRVKAESDGAAEKWEAELNRAHMLKVNGPPVVSKGITLIDSPSAKTAARQVRACHPPCVGTLAPCAMRRTMSHMPCTLCIFPPHSPIPMPGCDVLLCGLHHTGK